MNHSIIRTQLCNDFPSMYIKEIDAALKLYKYSYPATYYYLEEKQKKNEFKAKKNQGKQKVIDQHDLDKFKSVFNSVKTYLECSCCCNDILFENFGQCTDGHLVCKDCIKKHAENTIYHNLSSKINCIEYNNNCMGVFEEETLGCILSDRVMLEYRNLKKIEEIKSICVEDINIKLCHHCGSGTDIGETIQDLLVCMECFKDTCLKCNQVAHPGNLCYTLGNITQNKRHEIEDKMTEALLVKCNNCKTNIFKNEGCNKVTCVCGTHNCYLCKEIIPKNIGYSHFCREHQCTKKNGSKCDMCHLWQQDTKILLLNAVANDYNEETKKLIDKLL